uniref:Uncharacterized protein n=1 Tax=Oryza rufipogon TaxID=4529 RepID=A0A0E0PTY9_ORYRU
MLAFRIHDNKVSIVEKLCSVGSSGCCVGAPYNFAISRRAKVPSFWKVSLEPFPFTGASRFAVQATVFSDDLENQMEKQAAGSSSREHEKEITVAKMQKRLMATNLSLGSAHCPTLPVVPYCRRNERAVNHSSCSWRRRSRGRWCPGIAGGGAERRAQGYEPRRPVSALPVSCCPVGAARLGVESPLQCLHDAE